MKTETERLFNAPWQKSFQDWESYKEITIYDSKKQPVCLTRNKEMSNRLARLPELYDSLDDAQKVLKEVLIEWSNGGDYDTYIAKKRKETGKAPPDYFVEWLELLKNVIEGNDNAR